MSSIGEVDDPLIDLCENFRPKIDFHHNPQILYHFSMTGIS